MDNTQLIQRIETLETQMREHAHNGFLGGQVYYKDIMALPVLIGSGSPNTVVLATKGTLFLRTDGSSTSTRAYINTDGAKAWTAITTAT